MLDIGGDHRKYWILVAMGAMLGVILLAETVVGVALPAIRRDLGLSAIGSHWVVNIYMLALAGFAAVSGRIADIVGHKIVTISGLTIFGLGSIACGFADSGAWLLILRGIQGLGAAIIFPASLAMVTLVFPAAQRGMALGIAGSIGTVFLALGPLAGGFFTDVLSWRWIFWINTPFILAIGAVVLLAWTDPPREGPAEHVDRSGFILLVAGLSLVVFATMEVPDFGLDDPTIWFLFVAGLVLMAAFVFVEQRKTQPLINVELFGNATFAGCNLVIFAAQYSKMAVFIFVALYLQDKLQMSALTAGFALLPSIAALPFLAPVVGRIADRFGTRWPTLIGAMMLAIGVAWIGIAEASDQYILMLPGLVIWGMSLSLVFLPPRRAVMNAVPQGKQGQAGGIAMTSQLLGATIGMAVCSALYSLTNNFQVVFLVNAAFSLVVFAIGWLTIEPPVRAQVAATKPRP